MIVTENQLDEWARSHAVAAQGAIVELVYRLVCASSPTPKMRRFPLGDSIGQPGADGILDTDYGDSPFVPEGRSYWEIGTSINPGRKATSDYSGLTTKKSTALPVKERQISTFIFVTPASARRGWNQSSQTKWLKTRKEKAEWKNVEIIDGTKLIDWMRKYPAVELWFAEKIGIPAYQIETPQSRWDLLRNIGSPPPLSEKVFLANRDSACRKLDEVFDGKLTRLRLDTHFPDQASDFVCAYIASLDDERKAELFGRTLLISAAEAWNSVCGLKDRHILIAEHELDFSGQAGVRLLEKAYRANHTVIYAGLPGGLPDLSRESIPNPKSYQIEEALKDVGYREERARILAAQSNGNVGSLLRLLQNLSIRPEWAEQTDAAELVIASLLGGWTESAEADQEAVEAIAGKPFGEWIAKIRDAACYPGTPLNHYENAWKFTLRYEGWYALGSKVFDEHLVRIRKTATNVFVESDPKFELDPNEHYLSAVRGKVVSTSGLLRRGLAECLALLGSHSSALLACTKGRPESTAAVAVREILSGADWKRWATLNDFLPLFAEAAPIEFLDSVDIALSQDPCPFGLVFAQEGDGFTGGNYITGLLWAMETLAWSEKYLGRVSVMLAELAERDPGGSWSNRPANSLTTIFLPWRPQTTAGMKARVSIVRSLCARNSAVAWELVLSLLPNAHQITSGSRRPEWRELIPESWTGEVTDKDYWAQVTDYVAIAVELAKADLDKLLSLLGRLDDLPFEAFESVLSHLESEQILALDDPDRMRIWTKLSDLANKHKKFSEAKWAMRPTEVARIESVADILKPDDPLVTHQRLFSGKETDLFDERGDWEAQRKKLEQQQQAAIQQIFELGGARSVFNFALEVASPWRVGIAFGACSLTSADKAVLPTKLLDEDKKLMQMAGGYIWARFREKGWEWVDELPMSSWVSAEIGQFFSYLPFDSHAWKRVSKWLSEDESEYWLRVSAHPHDEPDNLHYAVERFLMFGRPKSAIRCLHVRVESKRSQIDSSQAMRALRDAVRSDEPGGPLDTYETLELIQFLQDAADAPKDEVATIEWAYLKLFDRGRKGPFPKCLENKVAESASLYCDFIEMIFRSDHDDGKQREVTEDAKALAENAYRLLTHWRIVPGAINNEHFDGKAFNRWLESVVSRTSQSGHFDVAMSMLGHVLIHSPPDPSGLWLHNVIAAALDENRFKSLRSGFRTALYNARGVHWVDHTGAAELELATQYHTKADAVDAAGFYRLAAMLRELAVAYETEASQVVARHRFSD